METLPARPSAPVLSEAAGRARMLREVFAEGAEMLRRRTWGDGVSCVLGVGASPSVVEELRAALGRAEGGPAEFLPEHDSDLVRVVALRRRRARDGTRSELAGWEVYVPPAGSGVLDWGLYDDHRSSLTSELTVAEALTAARGSWPTCELVTDAAAAPLPSGVSAGRVREVVELLRVEAYDVVLSLPVPVYEQVAGEVRLLGASRVYVHTGAGFDGPDLVKVCPLSDDPWQASWSHVWLAPAGFSAAASEIYGTLRRDGAPLDVAEGAALALA